MVSAPINPATPDLIPVPPEWLQRQQQSQGPNANRNINDIYWRKPDGWIVVGPSAIPNPNDSMRPMTRQAETLIRKGWTPLIEYSYTDRVSSRTGLRETIETSADRLGTPDRYYWLFKNGGAPLFTIAQIVEHHWHITPPFGLPKSVFPQLDEWDVPEPRWCPQCVNRAPMNSDEQVVKHLILMHQPMTQQQARDLLQFAQEKPVAAGGVPIRRKQAIEQAHTEAEEIIEQAKEERAPKLIVCDQCGEQFKDYLARARHVKKEHAY